VMLCALDPGQHEPPLPDPTMLERLRAAWDNLRGDNDTEPAPTTQPDGKEEGIAVRHDKDTTKEAEQIRAAAPEKKEKEGSKKEEAPNDEDESSSASGETRIEV